MDTVGMELEEETLKPTDKKRLLAFGYLSPLFLLLTVIVVSLLIHLVLKGASVVTVGLLTMVVAELLCVGLAVSLIPKNLDWRQVLGLRNLKAVQFFVGGFIGLNFFFGLILLGYIYSLFGHEAGSSNTSSQLGGVSGIEKYLILFGGISLIVPIAEELFFRGFVLNFLALGHKIKANLSIVATTLTVPVLYSSVIFSLGHFQGFSTLMDFTVLGWTFLFGIVSAMCRLKTGNLSISISSHVVYNLCNALAILLILS